MSENKSLKSYIEELIQEVEKELDESNVTGNVDGYQTPHAFSRKSDNERRKKTATQFGYELVDNDVKNIDESVNEALSVDPRKVYGGTAAKEGMVLTAQKGLMKILDLSKKNPSNVFLVSDDNYTNFGPYYIKNGKVAKYTVANPNYDLEKNKVSNLKVKSDVILKFKIVEGVESVNEVGAGDWHFKAIQKLYQKAGTFGRKKIAGLITKNPNSSWDKIEKALRGSDYDDVTYYTDMLKLESVVNKMKSVNEASNDKQKVVDYLVKKGNNKNDAQKMVDKNYDYVSKKYNGASVSKKAEIISGLQESLNEASLKPKKLTQLKKGEKFVFNNEPFEFIELYTDIPDAAKVKMQNGRTSVISFGGGIVNKNTKGGFSDYLKQGGRVWDNVNTHGNLVNENRWLELKNDTSMHANKKLAVGLKELKYQLAEVEKFFSWYNKIKNINELDSDNYWKRTNTHIYKIKERLINIAKTLQEIEK